MPSLATLKLIGGLAVACSHHCATPVAAYRAADVGDTAELSQPDQSALDRYADCVCGPEGTVDTDPVPDARGRYFSEPHCNRDGWNGRRYPKEPK